MASIELKSYDPPSAISLMRSIVAIIFRAISLILTVAHDLIEDDDTNRPDPGMIVADQRVKARKLKKEDVIKVLESVQLATQMITIVDPRDHTFELNAPVDTILEALAAEFEDSTKPTGSGKDRTRRVPQ